MKSLNKKISAILLAGAVVVGGFAASGVSADAFSMVAREKIELVKGYQEFKKVCDKLGILILDASKRESRVNAWIKSNLPKLPKKVRDRLLKEKKVFVDEKQFIKSDLIKSKVKLHKVRVAGIYYLIRLK